jgi:hypothetical protein
LSCADYYSRGSFLALDRPTTQSLARLLTRNARLLVLRIDVLCAAPLQQLMPLLRGVQRNYTLRELAFAYSYITPNVFLRTIDSITFRNDEVCAVP